MLSTLYLFTFSAIAGPLTRAQTQARSLDKTINTVEAMVHDPAANRLAKRYGLNLVNVSWEDTGRSKNSSLGPNISDLTIGVRDSRDRLHPMPVYRFNNYHDKTADIDADELWVRTGNQAGKPLRTTALVDVLSEIKDYLHSPESLRGRADNFIQSSDTHLLVSAQACFLPVSSHGKTTFTPVIYNYQSRPGDPAVLTLVATREGTSVQVVENKSGYMSEVLYFNDDGERAPFTATRLSTFKAHGGDKTTAAADVAPDAGLDVVLIIQIPLKTTNTGLYSSGIGLGGAGMAENAMIPQSAPAQRRGDADVSDVEVAVIGHGKTEGRFKEINGLRIQRDARFPIRVTAQFYKATSNGVVTESDVAALKSQIERVYGDADYVGSLVSDGMTRRPTEWVHRRESAQPWARPAWDWHKAF
jgi:hypothetical protein